MKKWILFCLLYTNCLIAQEPYMFQFTDENGLSSMTVYQIIQDQHGYIWVGSAKGVSRYDGREFIHIDLSKLLDREIIYLSEDHLGRIWINNLSGQIAWVEDLKLHLLNIKDVPEQHVPMRFLLKDSTVLINYMGGIELPKSLIQFHVTHANELSGGNFIRSEESIPSFSHINYNGKSYMESVIYRNDSLRFHYIQDERLHYEYFDIQNKKIKTRIGSFKLLFVDDKARYYFSNNMVVLRFDKENETLELIYDCSENQINKIYVFDSQIWLFTKDGVIVFDSESLQQRYVLLKGKNSNNLFLDNEKNLWLATAAHGVYLMFNIDLLTYNGRNSLLPKSDIHSLHYDHKDKVVYIGMSGGYLSKYSISQERFENLKLPKSGRVVSISEDIERRIWLSLDDGICFIDQKKEEVVNTWITVACKVFQEDALHRFWFGTSNNLFKWENYNNMMRSNKRHPHILDKRISALKEDYSHKNWIGTTEGLYVYDNDSIRPFYFDEKLKFYSISAIEQTEDSSIWVATANEGLIQIKDDIIMKQYSSQNGLTSNNCLSLFAYDDDLIIGTDNGLSILNYNTGVISQINMRDGLPSGEINCVVSDDKMIWMGTPKGLVVLDRNRVPKIHRAPPIRIANFKINGQSQNFEGSITLSHNENTVDIEYIGLDIKSNQKETYEYRLKGLNDNWLSTNTRIARFHTLPADDYLFQVKTVNDIGIKSQNTANLKFTIKGPWWKSTWFYIGSVLLSFVILGSIIYWRVNEKRKREKIEYELKERIQHLKSESLKSQLNPHFIYNSLNAIQDFFVTHDEESALLYLSKIANMIRQIFDYSSRDTITLQEEIEFLSLYLDLEKLRFGDRVQVIFEIEKSVKIKMEEYEIPPLILQPVIENVFKHGLMHKLEGGKVQILFKTEGDQIKCVIEDNGIGRKASNELKSWRQQNRRKGGLQGVIERLSIWKNESNKRPFEMIDLMDRNGIPIGTRVIIII